MTSRWSLFDVHLCAERAKRPHDSRKTRGQTVDSTDPARRISHQTEERGGERKVWVAPRIHLGCAKRPIWSTLDDDTIPGQLDLHIEPTQDVT